MIKKIIILFLLYVQTAVAQQKNLEVNGDIIDTAGVGVENCTVTLSGTKDGLIYSHFNMGNSNTFKVSIPLRRQDSLTVEINHLSFSTFRKVYAIDPGFASRRLSITLHTEVRNLKQVNIAAPRIWKRGDTTFFKAEKFKEGDEKKLKDLLLKLPEFRQSIDGQITYKNKPIDKITIDGEELFSDKVELMFNNFPVHVLNTIQVIENQNVQRLLKGITGGNKTFINLQINKKNSLSTAFGELDAGLGTLDRYNFSPVVFSIYSQVKVGFIGNYNSIGNGIGLQQEGELRNLPERDAEQLLMSNHNLYLINNFEQRWYIQNQQWDNRFQVNTRLNKTTHSQTEISYVRDKQPQWDYNSSSLLNNGQYEKRIDSSSNLYKPSILSLKQTFTIQPDSVSDLNIMFNLYDDHSAGQQSTKFNGFGIASPLAIATQNQWTSLTLSGNYTIRHTSRKASTISLLINNQNLGQTARGESTDIAGIFSLPGDYNQMNDLIHSKSLTISGSWNLVIKDKTNHLTRFGLALEHREIGLSQEFLIDQRQGQLPIINENELGNESKYQVTKFTGSYSRSFNFIFKTPFTFNTELGGSHFSPKSKDSISSFTTFIFKSTISNDHTFAEGLSGKLNAGFYQWQLEPEQLYSGYYPTSILSFKRTGDVTLPLRKVEATYSLAYKLPNDLTTFSVFGSDAFMPNGIISGNLYKSFLSFTDSYVMNKSTNRKSVGFSASIPSIWLNAMIDFNASYGSSNYLISSANEITETNLNYYTLFLSLKKNWNRKYFIRLSSILFTNISHFPQNAGDTESKVSSLKNNFYQRLLINKQMNIIANFDLFYNNLFTPNRAQTVMADVECNYQLKHSPIFLSLKGENLFNEKYYYNFNNSVLAQSFTTVPLIGRSLFASVRYTF